MKKFFENKPRAWFIIGSVLLLVLTATAIGINYLAGNSDVLARVGDEEITKSDLSQAAYGLAFDTTEADSLSQENKDLLLAKLVEQEIARQEADKLGITVTDAEILENIQKNLGSSYDKYTEEQKAQTRSNTRAELLLQKVKDQSLGYREGQYLVFNFHKYFNTTNKDYQTTGTGDAALIEKQKTEALRLATELSDKLRAGTVTFEDAKKTLLANKLVGESAMLPRTPVMWSDFDKNIFTEGLDVFSKNNIKDGVFALSKGEVSEPLVDSDNFDGETKEYRYLIFNITNSSAGQYKTYEEWLNAKKTEYKVNEKVALLSLIPQAIAAPSQCAGACNADNADLYVKLQWATRTNSVLPYTNEAVRFYGGASNDYALAKDGSSCGTKVYSLDGTTNTNGNSSICGLDYSFYCGTSRIAYIRLFDSEADIDRNGVDDNIVGLGKWRWDYPRDGDYDANTTTNLDSNREYILRKTNQTPAYYQVGLNLNSADNYDKTQFNGKTVYNTFTYYPHWNDNPVANGWIADAAGSYFSGGLSESSPWTFSIGTATTKNIRFGANATDSNSDKWAVWVGYSKKNTDGTWGTEQRYPAVAGEVSENGWRPTVTSTSTVVGFNTTNQFWPTASTFTSLGLGTYKIRYQAADEHYKYSDYITRYLVIRSGTTTELCTDPTATNYGQPLPCIPATSSTPDFSCSVTPETGLAPLVVSVITNNIVNIANPVFDYDMNGDGTYEYTNRTTPVYYTYDKGGTYVVKVRETSSNPDLIRTCVPNPVDVTDPTDAGGGEVTP